VAPENRARELRTRGFTVLTQDSQGSQMVGLLTSSRGRQIPCIAQVAINSTVTKQQLYLFGCLYLTILAVVVVLTRATPRRFVGALVGAAAMGGAGLGIVAIGESARWWHFVMTWEPYFLTLMWIGMIPCGFIFLITWRIARRFGGRGLAVVAFVAAVLGPVRDYRYMATFPEWGAYAPGLAPVFAISVAYVILGILGHGTMRLVAGPAPADRLARRPWEPA
jgi:hypothetical protein